jgi:hypothetical protein
MSEQLQELYLVSGEMLKSIEERPTLDYNKVYSAIVEEGESVGGAAPKGGRKQLPFPWQQRIVIKKSTHGRGTKKAHV